MAGKGAAEGGRSGSVRNPEKYCARSACKNYPVKGSTLCRIHGAHREAAARRVASAVVAGEAGLDTIKLRDIPQVVQGLVSWHLGLIQALQKEMDDLRLVDGAIGMAREYEDILRRLDASSTSVAKLMTSVAALGIADSFRAQANAMTEAQRTDRVNRLLALTLEAEATVDMWRCPVCSRACCSAQVVDVDVLDDIG